MTKNAYTDRAMMIVVQSGKDRLNQWIEQERNVYQDDTDNTGEQARAYYGDIVFAKAAGPHRSTPEEQH